MAQHTDPRAGAAGNERTPDWDEVVKRAVIQTAATDLPEDEGLSRVLGRIRADNRATQASRKPQATRGQGWLDWFAGLMAPRPVFATMAAVLVAQLAIIVSIWPNQNLSEDYAGFRSHPGQTNIEQPFIRVSFKPEATEYDMRMLLREVAVEIVAGPSQLGEYYLLAPKGEVASVRDLLASNAQIERVDLVDQLPPTGY